MKPTYGRVSRRGVLPLSYSLDHVGPMTRTVRDNALLLQVIARHDAHDPGSADVRGARLLRRPRARREGPEARPHPALLRRGHAGPPRAGAGDRERGGRAAGPRRRRARDPAAAARRLRHLHAHHHPLRGVRHPRRWMARAARRLRRSRPPAHPGRRGRERRRLHRRAAACGGRLTRRRSRPSPASMRPSPCPAWTRPAASTMPRPVSRRLPAPGAPAVQRHRAAGHRHPRRLHAGRPAAVAATDRPPLGRRRCSTASPTPTSAPRRGRSGIRRGCRCRSGQAKRRPHSRRAPLVLGLRFARPNLRAKAGYKNFSKWYRRMPPPSVLLLAASAISSRTRR